jgi:hypothetical protein
VDQTFYIGLALFTEPHVVIVIILAHLVCIHTILPQVGTLQSRASGNHLSHASSLSRDSRYCGY